MMTASTECTAPLPAVTSARLVRAPLKLIAKEQLKLIGKEQLKLIGKEQMKLIGKEQLKLIGNEQDFTLRCTNAQKSEKKREMLSCCINNKGGRPANKCSKSQVRKFCGLNFFRTFRKFAIHIFFAIFGSANCEPDYFRKSANT
jgi:hypothetical protein